MLLILNHQTLRVTQIIQCIKKFTGNVMYKSELSNINISDEQVIITPNELKKKIPLSDDARQFHPSITSNYF